MSDILKEICAKRHDDVMEMRKNHPIAELQSQVKSLNSTRPFADTIRDKIKNKHPALIAEVKRASPSQGDIRHNFEPVDIAQAYEDAGASCLSVLTEPHWFKGDDAYIEQIKKEVTLPVLRKDFMVDPYQIVQSRCIGADCILIIMAALSNMQAAELCDAAREYDLDILVEVHDFDERDRVLNTGLPFDLLGINNRNLKTMDIDLETTIKLSRDLPPDIPVVCESGLNTHQDLQKMMDNGIYSFLIGTSLMRHVDPGIAARKILGT